ncbi:MAG TPA: hypothetical protein VK465_05685 [Fibrobacteria bacterium]|nr:hypothetical protein [Fibrobacteria bacterium]
MKDILFGYLSSSGTKKILRLIQYVTGSGGTGFATSLIFGRRISSSDEVEMSEHRTDIETHHTLSAKSNSRHRIYALENQSLASMVEVVGVKGTTFSRRTFGVYSSTRTAVPSTGAWRQGDLVLDATKDSYTLGWKCIRSGTFGSLTFTNCITDNGSDVIRGIVPTGLNVGDYIYVSAAFADTTNAKQILLIDTTNSRIVVDDTANANNSGVTVTTTDPVFLTLPGMLSASTTWDPGNMAADGNVVSTTITVTGAAVGDQASASLTTIGANDVLISAHVQAADTVRVILMNKTGGALDIASGTLAVKVWK